MVGCAASAASGEAIGMIDIEPTANSVVIELVDIYTEYYYEQAAQVLEQHREVGV